MAKTFSYEWTRAALRVLQCERKVQMYLEQCQESENDGQPADRAERFWNIWCDRRDKALRAWWKIDRAELSA